MHGFKTMHNVTNQMALITYLAKLWVKGPSRSDDRIFQIGLAGKRFDIYFLFFHEIRHP